MNIFKNKKVFHGKGPIDIAQFLEGIVGGLAIYMIIFIIRDDILHSYKLNPFVTGLTIAFSWATVWWIRKSSLNIFNKLIGSGYTFVVALVVVFASFLIIYINQFENWVYIFQKIFVHLFSEILYPNV